jgi:ring-1,2-phenylacetyl-CoA epoxidase subunit PaaE
LAHFRLLTIKDVRRETADCVSVAFEIPAEWKEEIHFKQGQNITVKTVVQGEELRRSYSICSSPFDQELRIAVKRIENGKFSTHANQQLRKGDRVEVMAPSGKFFTGLNPQQAKNYLAFASGSGITPIISIIKTTLITEPESSFTLVYGNRDRHSIIFREVLEAFKNQYIDRFAIHFILSREKTDASIYQGRIDADKCKILFSKLIDPTQMDDIFLCGPEQMIFTVKKTLEEIGTGNEKIHFELFTIPGQELKKQQLNSASSATTSEETGHVTIKVDGVSFEMDLAFDGITVLDAALQAGADLPYACKGGVCASCRARLTEGKVEMDTNYALETDELEAGFILTCQSHPRSPVVKIDFDSK